VTAWRWADRILSVDWISRVSLLSMLLIGLCRCSGKGEGPIDSGQASDGPTDGDAASIPADAAQPTDVGPVVATGTACTDINLSCNRPEYPDCIEFSNADDAKVAEVQAYCATVQGILARGACPAEKVAGCAHHETTPCEDVWYYAGTPEFIRQFCPDTLILP
jgi:hypothetical protein